VSTKNASAVVPATVKFEPSVERRTVYAIARGSGVQKTSTWPTPTTKNSAGIRWVEMAREDPSGALRGWVVRKQSVASLFLAQEIAHESGKKWTCSGESVTKLPGCWLLARLSA
jgi:hypothetical protein